MTGQSPDRAARAGGILLLLTAAATAVMVFARVSADVDQATLLESLLAVADNRVMYSVAGIARFLSGITLLAAAWFLWRTWAIRERFAAPLVPYLFALSGVCTAVSGVCAVLIAVYPRPEVTFANGIPAGEIAPIVEVMSDLRWITGKVGFTAAGVALIIAARYQWQVGGTLRRVAPVSAFIGVAMQFIWVDAAAVMHQVAGPAFFLWLLAIGAMLAAGRVERHFITHYFGGRSSS